jgi:hypothetical protein
VDGLFHPQKIKTKNNPKKTTNGRKKTVLLRSCGLHFPSFASGVLSILARRAIAAGTRGDMEGWLTKEGGFFKSWQRSVNGQHDGGWEGE